ncbi:MAG: tRNA (guanine46-N7-)-methyltransferase [Chitinophagaceae bacterium]|jgi:tRNA (guanine-N7-)-methyltransferase|nr:tRNA (guanine46-N7-)-methyltransferase [Chitinophagaceae bacterium]
MQHYNRFNSPTTVFSRAAPVKLRFIFAVVGQKKLIRFEEIKGFSNVLEFPKEIMGNWSRHFGNANPIVLELACGKGEYAVGLGERYPQMNFIGVDIKGNRIWRGAKTALEKGLGNVAFLRTQIDQVGEYFAPAEVNGIWITFPDPQLRMSKAKKRLTHPKFLRIYGQFLRPGGEIHLKTDSPALYEFTRQVVSLYRLPLLEDVDDVYALPGVSPDLQIKTHYEKLDIARSNRVHYLRFTLDGELPVEKDEILKQLLREQEATG